MLPAALASVVTAVGFLASIPAEPGAVVLVEGSIHQAVAVDLDGDGAREIVVLAGGNADASVTIDAWGEGVGGRWSRVSEPALAVASAAPAAPDASGSPVRLLVRRVGGAERLTLLRQTAADTACCLALHDVVLGDRGLQLVPIADTAGSVDAIWVIDLDGDGTDELVASRSVPPLGDTSYPVDVFVHRWTGSGFAVTASRLPAGSGDTPFILGDTDGRPGEELGIIATLGRPELHRVSLRPGDVLGIEDAGLVAQAATAVRIGDGRGIAVLTSTGTLAVHAWPFEDGLEAPVAQRVIGDGELLGSVEIDGTPRLVVRQPGTAERLHVLGLPGLTPPLFGAVTRSPTAAAFASGPVMPYVGPLPGGDAEGRPAIVYSGRLLSSIDPAAVVPVPEQAIAALAGVQPIGVVGQGGSSIALLHAAGGPALPDPAGGRLDPPRARPETVVSVASLVRTLEPEREGGLLVPPIGGAVALDGRGTVAVGSAGFTVTIDAPPGSRIYVAGTDPSITVAAFGVPEAGSLTVPMPPPSVASPQPRYRATLAVVTPAGHSYLATWDVRVLTEPPPLRAAATTPLGSERVEVSGVSSPIAAVTVDGREVAVAADGRFVTSVAVPPWPTDVTVSAVDPLGNEARTTVSAIGWIDYRQLPWIPIAVALVAAAAAVLYLRVPRTDPAPSRADDDAALEELEPD